MPEQREWLRFGAVGVAALVGVPGDFVSLALDRLYSCLDETPAGKRARKLSISAARPPVALTRHHDPATVESARLAGEDLLARFGLSDKAFVALNLNPERAANAVLHNARFSIDERVEIEPLCGQLLVGFYQNIVETPDLSADLLPGIHKEQLRRLGRIESKQDRALETLDAIRDDNADARAAILARLDGTGPPIQMPELDELAAQTTLDTYFDAFQKRNNTTRAWCETVISTSHGTASKEAIQATLGTGHGVLVKGGSGMGKTILSRSIQTEMSRRGIPFVEIEAIYYCGDLQSLIDTFLLSLRSSGVDIFLACCKIQGLRVVLYVDGINECPRQHLRRLGQEIDAMANTHGVIPLLTSQTPCDCLLTPLEVYELSPPSIEEKRAIASRHGRFGREAEDLLRLACTGLEASLVGEIATQDPKPDSRADIFSRYVDERLGEDATGIEARDALRCLASVMHRRVAMVALRSELQRLVVSRSEPGAIEARVQSSGLVKTSLGSVSFSHELWKDFFAGEALLLSQADPQAFGSELSREINAELLPFALGLAGGQHAENGVAGLGTAALLNCLLGNCGSAPRAAAKARCARALTHLNAAIARFDVNWSPRSDNWSGALVIPPDMQPFDLDALEAVGYEFCRSKDGIGRMLEIIGKVDQRIESLRRQRQMAGSKVPRSVFFAQIYIGFATPAPFRAIISVTENLSVPPQLSSLPVADYTPGKETLREIMKLVFVDDWTFGQYYFLLKLLRIADIPDAHSMNVKYDFACQFMELVKQLWDSAPYHLQLALFDTLKTVIFRNEHDNEIKKRACELCKEILPSAPPALNVDVWEILDYLEDTYNGANLNAIEREIHEILSSEPSEDVYREAYRAWMLQNDGPWQRAYAEVFSLLSEKQRVRLEELAFMSLEEPALLDIILVERAAAKPRAEFEPVFRRLARPPINAFFRQDATRAFLLAVAGLSRLNVEMPIADNAKGGVAAWWAVAEIFHELASVESASEEHIRRAWSRLCGPLIHDAMEPISDILRAESGDRESSLQVSVIREYPAELRCIARHNLARHEESECKREWKRIEYLGTAIELIRAYGEREDVELLRQFVDDSNCARAAIRAIKALQAAD